MKRISALICVAALSCLVACTCGGQYGDVKAFINDMVSIQEDYISSVKNAKNPDDVVGATRQFGDRFLGLSARSSELKKKYADIATWDKNPPEALREDFARIEQVSGKLQKAFTDSGFMKYMGDRKVQEAFMELGKKMQQAKFFE
jgi:hypothetical protein